MKPIDITPEDSVSPVYLVALTPKELAEREKMATEEYLRAEDEKQAEKDRKNAIDSAAKKLAAFGLTPDELRAVIGSQT